MSIKVIERVLSIGASRRASVQDRAHPPAPPARPEKRCLHRSLTDAEPGGVNGSLITETETRRTAQLQRSNNQNLSFSTQPTEEILSAVHRNKSKAIIGEKLLATVVFTFMGATP